MSNRTTAFHLRAGAPLLPVLPGSAWNCHMPVGFRTTIQSPHRNQGTPRRDRSEEHTSELQSLMRISYAVFCLKKKTTKNKNNLITLIRTTITSQHIAFIN